MPLPTDQARPDARYALAVHGGAGHIATDLSPEQKHRYEAGLTAALRAGRSILEAGGPSVDAVDATVRVMEDDELFNAARGAVFTAEGVHELDAAIMDGRTLACGAVAAIKTVRNPIGLARLVMEQSGHVLLAGDGAEAFADRMGVPRVENNYFSTLARRDELVHKLATLKSNPNAVYKNRGTVGAVALDLNGHLAAATSTGGMTAKRYGRIGDSPILGCGTFADDRTAAISCTGVGEEFIRHGVARDISARIAYLGQSLEEAVNHLLHNVLRPEDGGLIAVDRHGNTVLAFNTHGMYRGRCDSTGMFEVAMYG